MSEPLGMNLRSIFVFLAIILTVTYMLGLFGYGWLAILVGIVGLVILTLWFIYRYLTSLRGYQDRYGRSGREAVGQQRMFRLFGLALAIMLTFSILSNRIGNTAIAFLITALIYTVIIKLVDNYSGKLMQEYVDHKKMRHNQFVDSISNVSGKCLSCQKKLAVDEKFCPHCGFEQRDIKPDSSYIKK